MKVKREQHVLLPAEKHENKVDLHGLTTEILTVQSLQKPPVQSHHITELSVSNNQMH